MLSFCISLGQGLVQAFIFDTYATFFVLSSTVCDTGPLHLTTYRNRCFGRSAWITRAVAGLTRGQGRPPPSLHLEGAISHSEKLAEEPFGCVQLGFTPVNNAAPAWGTFLSRRLPAARRRTYTATRLPARSYQRTIPAAATAATRLYEAARRLHLGRGRTAILCIQGYPDVAVCCHAAAHCIEIVEEDSQHRGGGSMESSSAIQMIVK